MNSSESAPEPNTGDRPTQPSQPPVPAPAGSAPLAPTSAPDDLPIGTDGVLLAEPSDAVAALPQPGLIVAAALTTVPLLAQIFVGLFLAIAATLVFVIATARPHDVMQYWSDFQLMLLPVGTLVTLLVAVAVCWLFFGRDLGRKIGWRGVSFGQLMCVLALTIPLAVLASEVTNCVGAMMQHFEAEWLHVLRESGSELFHGFVAQPAWLVFLGGCLLPGLGEEVYCRGLLSRGLVARYGVVGGTLLAAGLFGAMHLEPVQAIGAFALGIGLQFVFLTTRSLVAPILLHTLNNSFAFLTMRFADAYPIPGLTPMPDGSSPHTPIIVLATAVIASCAVMAILFQNRTKWRLPDGSTWNPGYVTAEIPAPSVRAVAIHGEVNPKLIVAAVIALAALAASLIAAHFSVAVSP